MGGGGGGVDIKDSELNKELAGIADSKWTHYNEVNIPAQNRWMEDRSKMNDKAHLDKAEGEGNVAVNRATGKAEAEALEQGGNVAQLNAGISKSAIKKQSMGTDVESRMVSEKGNEYIGGLQAINSVGQGKEAKALNTGSSAANYANRYATDEANKSFRKNQDNKELVGMGIGAATRYGIG